MSNFFKYQTELDSTNAFKQFGPAHLTAIILIAVLLFLSLRMLSKKSDKTKDTVIKIAAIAVPLVEFTHTFWLYASGETELIKLLPLHLCAMQSIFIPLAVFTKKVVFKEFIFCTSILGGIFAILFPAGVAGVYPFFHYQSLQTLLLHSLLIFVPLALILCKGFVPKVSNFLHVLMLFLGVASLTAIVDFSFGQNYMFLNTAPAGTPLELIYNAFGRSAYLGVTFLALGGVCLALYMCFAVNRKAFSTDGLQALKNKI